MFKVIFLVFILFLSGCGAKQNSDLSGCDMEYLQKNFVPYCTDENLCKDKPELYMGDIVCAFSDYYSLKMKEDMGRNGISNKDVGFFEKNVVAFDYYGGGEWGIIYCEFDNNECVVKREFYCDSKVLKGGGSLFCASYTYKINGIQVDINGLLVGDDDFLKFVFDRIPENRERIKHFGNLEVLYN